MVPCTIEAHSKVAIIDAVACRRSMNEKVDSQFKPQHTNLSLGITDSIVLICHMMK